MFKVNNKNFTPFFSVSIVEFEQVNVSWDGGLKKYQDKLLLKIMSFIYQME